MNNYNGHYESEVSAGSSSGDDWLIQSILVTIFCCQILGIIAIVFAAMAKGQYSSGNMAQGDEYAKTAKNFCIAGIVIGLIWVPFIFLGF